MSWRREHRNFEYIWLVKMQLKDREKYVLAFLFLLLIISIVYIISEKPSGHVLLDPEEEFQGLSLNHTYDYMMDSLFLDTRAVTLVDDMLWVPWYSTSHSCRVADLHRGAACNATVNSTNNCMVTDELSQVGLLVAMGNNQSRMEQYYNILIAINSSHGDLPAWKVYRNNTIIEPCRPGINSNCDTASDANARIIISLFTAGRNPAFDETVRNEYFSLAQKLTSSFVTYEVDYSCRKSSLGYGDICYWLTAGSVARQHGPQTIDYAYTGYYGDAIIAMLQACRLTGNRTYCTIAKDFTLNFLQAAEFDGKNFSAPPGRSFRWVNLDGVPRAECTNTCSPVQWDGADAPRAIGICLANYYAEQINYKLPGLGEYCAAWEQRHMKSAYFFPLQYYPDGNNSATEQSSYFAQGLQSLFLAGTNKERYKESLLSSLSHFQPSTRRWDSSSCFGIYHSAFAIRSLGIGLGRDLPGFDIIIAE
jgi:hypothetical protein